jgi:hypothetical protein
LILAIQKTLNFTTMNLPKNTLRRKRWPLIAWGGMLAACMMLASCRAPVSLEVDSPMMSDLQSWVQVSRRLPTSHKGRWELEHIKINAEKVLPNGDGVYLCVMNYTTAFSRANRLVPVLRCGDRCWLATQNKARNQRRLARYAQLCSYEQDRAHWDELVQAFVPPTTRITPHGRGNWVDEI